MVNNKGREMWLKAIAPTKDSTVLAGTLLTCPDCGGLNHFPEFDRVDIYICCCCGEPVEVDHPTAPERTAWPLAESDRRFEYKELRGDFSNAD